MQDKSELLFQKGIHNFKFKNFIEAQKCFEELKILTQKIKIFLKIYHFVIFKITNFKTAKK